MHKSKCRNIPVMRKRNYKKIFLYKDNTFTPLQKPFGKKTYSPYRQIRNPAQYYVLKVDEMIKDGITKGRYIETTDNALSDLKQFQDFLHHNFYKYKDYEVTRLPFN